MELADWAAGVLPSAVQGALPDPAALPNINRKIRTDFFSAPGWRQVKVEYSCIPDAVYPWNPLVLKAIWEFAPDAVPLWVRWVFRSPQDEENPHDVVFGRHALGRRIEHLQMERLDFHCTMPSMPCQGLTFEKPNRIWFIHEGESPKERNVDLPGDYLPFDATIYDKAEAAAVGFRMTDKEYADHLREIMINKPLRDRERRQAAIAADMEDRDREWHKTADPIIERISDVEIGEYLKREKGSTP